jgi:hypothetical protein
VRTAVRHGRRGRLILRSSHPGLGDAHHEDRCLALALYHVANGSDDDGRVADVGDMHVLDRLGSPSQVLRVRRDVCGSIEDLTTVGRPDELLMQPTSQRLRVAGRQRLGAAVDRCQHVVWCDEQIMHGRRP